MNLKSSIILFLFLAMSCTKEITKIQVVEKPVIKTMIMYDTVVAIEKEFVDCEPAPVNVTVYFSFDSYELSPEAKHILDVVRNLPTGPLQVVGYADETGTDVYNYRLGLKRATEAYRYLGFEDPHIIASKGEGECSGESLYCRKVVVSGQN